MTYTKPILRRLGSLSEVTLSLPSPPLNGCVTCN